MPTLSEDINRNYILLVNDYNPEFEAATIKLSAHLKRSLRGLVLVDEKIKKSMSNKPIVGTFFQEIVCNYDDPASIVRALKPYREMLLAVNASSERNQPYYQKLIPHIPHLFTPTESSLIWATHKDKMRKMFASFDSSISPSFTKVTQESLDMSLDEIKKMNFPVISKPTGLAASILVKKADSFEQLTENIFYSMEAIESAYKKNKGRGTPCILVEEFMEGDMYSVDAYVDNQGNIWVLPPVKVITAASIGLEGYYSYAIYSDHGLVDEKINLLNECAKKAVHALSLRNSVAHIELFDTPNGWKIIELGPRAGGYRQDMYALTYEIDHAFNELLVKIGLPPHITTTSKRSSATINIYPDSEGRIESINGFDDAVNSDGVYWLKLHASTGDTALFCGNGGNFLVDGVVYGDSKTTTDMIMKKIRQTIKIIVRTS